MRLQDGFSPADFEADVKAVAEQRSRPAFQRLFDHFAPRVKAYMRRLGANDDVAEDLAQEVMLAVWRRAHQFNPSKAAVSTWIFTIARNKRVDVLRRERRPDADLDDPSLLPEPAIGGDMLVEVRQMSERAVRAMAALPAEQKRLIEIYYFEDKTHGTIAEELGLPLGTVKSRLRLAIGKLRAALEGDAP